MTKTGYLVDFEWVMDFVAISRKKVEKNSKNLVHV